MPSVPRVVGQSPQRALLLGLFFAKPELVGEAEQLMQAARVDDTNWPLSENPRPEAATKASTSKTAP